MAMSAMAGAGLVVIKTKLILGRFEAVLDGPAIAFLLTSAFEWTCVGHHVG